MESLRYVSLLTRLMECSIKIDTEQLYLTLHRCRSLAGRQTISSERLSRYRRLLSLCCCPSGIRLGGEKPMQVGLTLAVVVG